jgi:hypothetical protein
MNGQVYGTPIISWDFADGIPASWINDSEDEVSHWEYRGPSTDPDNTVCSLGSCGIDSSPITSETASNGFVIFDSNYWDDPIGPCGNIGSGEVPGPHHAWIITESIDLSAHENVVLAFQQQYKHFTSTTSVWASNDGGVNYTLIFENPNGQSTQSGPSEWVNVNASEFLGGESNVVLKFDFSGQYYWWLLDDITLFAPNANDLLISNPQYTTFNYEQDPYGFGDLEYHSYPQMMIPLFNYRATATNIGSDQQINVKLNIRIKNELDEVVYTANSNQTNVNPDASASLNIIGGQTPPSELGEYEIRFKLEQYQTDESPLNNEIIKDFAITPNEYSRDDGSLEDTFIPQGIYEGEPYEIGNFFEPTTNGLLVHSVGVVLSDETAIGTSVSAKVYNWNRTILYAESETHIVTEFDLNGIGGNHVLQLPLIDPIISAIDSLYLAMAVWDGGDGELLAIGRSGDALAETTLLSFPEVNGLFYLLKKPMVRLYIYNGTDSPGCTNPEAENYNALANVDDGSCSIQGCTDPEADNYNPDANFEDGSCMISGCTDENADNYNPDASEDDGSCIYLGCTDPGATNYDDSANQDDGSCVYSSAFMSANTMSGCAPLSVTITNQTELADGAECLFEISNGSNITECAQNFNVLFQNPGEYTITYTYTVGEFISTYTLGPIMVFENPAAPVLSFDQENNILSCAGCSGNSVIWFYNNDVIEGNSSSSWNPLDNGFYYVQIEDVNGCSAQSEPILVVVTDISEMLKSNEIVGYPNPASTQFTVKTNHSIEQLQVFDTQGRVIDEVMTISTQHTFNTSNWAQGIYFVRCLSDQKWHQLKFLVK